MNRSALVRLALIALAVVSLGDVALAKSLQTPQPLALRSTVPPAPQKAVPITPGTTGTVNVPGFDIQGSPEQRRAQRKERQAMQMSSGSTVPPPP